LIDDAVRAADLRHRGEELVVREPVTVEDRLDVLVGFGGREDEMLDGDEVVLERLRLVLGFLKERICPPADPRLGAAAHFRERVESLLELPPDGSGRSPGPLHERGPNGVALLEHRDQDVLRNYLWITRADGPITGGAQRLLALRRQSIHLHGSP